MKRTILVFALAGSFCVSPSQAQESFNVQAAMEQIRKENLQRIGVERQQQIISILRQRAEDMKAIEDAGYKVTPDGTLERRAVSASAANSDSADGQDGLSSGVGPDGVSQTDLDPAGDPFAEGDAENGNLPAWMRAGMGTPPESVGGNAGSPFSSLPFELRGILSDSAMFEVNGGNQRFAEGDTLPGGFTLLAINSRSVRIQQQGGREKTLFVDWSGTSESVASSGRSGSGSGGSDEPRTFMQSGEPVDDVLEPFQ